MKCEKCGDEMTHDDDGPRMCRFCNQCPEPIVDNADPAKLAQLVSHSRFVSLCRNDCRWEISYTPVEGDGLGCIVSDNLTNLLTVWDGMRVSQFACAPSDAEYQRGYKAGFDRGVAETLSAAEYSRGLNT